ncbi:MAG: hypothetical protein WCP68_16280, partial [Enhydrobacter sp.]
MKSSPIKFESRRNRGLPTHRHSSGYLDEAFALQIRENVDDVRPALILGYVERVGDRSTNVRHGSRRLEDVPDVNRSTLETKIDSLVEVQDS